MVLFVVVTFLSFVPVVRESQVRLTDALFRLAPTPEPPSPVVVVLIDEESLKIHGRWPWSRTLLARLVDNLSSAGTSAIGLDILLSEPQSSEADDALARSLRDSGRAIIVDKLAPLPDGPRWIEPLPAFSRWAGVGHAQAVLDPDSICRRFPPLELTLDGPRWAFAIEVARRADPEQAKKFGASHGLPAFDDAAAVTVIAPVLVRIPFRRDGFQEIPARAVLDGTALAAVRGRPVVVGFGSTELGDRVSTPLSGDWPTPGAEVHAQILDSILTGRVLGDLPLWLNAVVLLLTCALAIHVFQQSHGWAGFAWLAVLVPGCYGLALAVHVFAQRVLDAGPLILAVILAPLLVYSADFVSVERTVTRQLLALRAWLRPDATPGSAPKEGLDWKLHLVQHLQTELGALYELHNALLESTQDLIAIFDENGGLVLKNRSFAALCPHELANLTLDQLRVRLSPGTENGRMEGKTGSDAEVYLGEELYSLRLAPLPPTFLSPRGGTILTLSSLRNRQERDRARAEALGFITHELRTPLTSIQGFAELMTRYPDSPACATAPETIARESKRLVALIDSYLDLLRLDAGAQSWQPTSIDLDDLVTQVFEILQPLAAANRMGLRKQHGPTPVIIPGEAPLITGAILNLVSNAIKYGTPGTDIIVGCYQQGHEAMLTVENRGKAIPAADIPHVFESYYRAPHVEEAGRGWGVGLAFVKRIVEKHTGSISVVSDANGTTFHIRIPAETATADATKVAV